MTESAPVDPLPAMSTTEAVNTLARARADAPEDSPVGRALGVLLADYARLSAQEVEFARRLVPEVVQTYGERATVVVLQGLVPRLHPNPPTRRGGS